MGKINNLLIVSFIFAVAGVNTGCTNSFGIQEPTSTVNNVTPTPTPVVDSSTVTVLSTQTVSGYTMQKVRIKEDNLRAAYVAFFQSSVAGTRPTLLMIRPYDGISWSLETVDQTWAGRANAATGYDYDDENSFGWTTGQIHYQLASDASLRTAADYYLASGFNVAFVFNRFYAGGTIVDQIGDVAVALRYTSTHSKTDSSKIAVSGESWGAMLALFGVAQTSVSVQSLILDTPILDLANYSLFQSITLTGLAPSNLTDYQSLYSPFERRIYPETGGPIGQIGVDYSRWNQSAASTNLSSLAGRALVIADDSDTINPINATKDVVSSATATKASGLYCTSATAIDYENGPSHVSNAASPLTDGVRENFKQVELLLQIGFTGTNYSVDISSTELDAFMTQMQTRQGTDGKSAALLRFFKALAASNISVDDADTTRTGTGAALAQYYLETLWGAAPMADDDAVRTYLDSLTELP